MRCKSSRALRKILAFVTHQSHAMMSRLHCAESCVRITFAFAQNFQDSLRAFDILWPVFIYSRRRATDPLPRQHILPLAPLARSHPSRHRRNS